MGTIGSGGGTTTVGVTVVHSGAVEAGAEAACAGFWSAGEDVEGMLYRRPSS